MVGMCFINKTMKGKYFVCLGAVLLALLFSCSGREVQKKLKPIHTMIKSRNGKGASSAVVELLKDSSDEVIDIPASIDEEIDESFPSIDHLDEEEEIVNYLSGIMAEDFEIVDLNKCIDDLLNTYNKEKLLTTRNDIIKKLEDTSNMTEEEIKDLEKKLNDVILRLAKVK